MWIFGLIVVLGEYFGHLFCGLNFQAPVMLSYFRKKALQNFITHIASPLSWQNSFAKRAANPMLHHLFSCTRRVLSISFASLSLWMMSSNSAFFLLIL
jgi:hypothetical protein